MFQEEYYDEEKRGKLEDKPKKRSESGGEVKCQYHRVLYLHELRMMEIKNNMPCIDFDDFVKIYSGDYLYINDVGIFLDACEVIFTIYNDKDHKFYNIRTFFKYHQHKTLMDLNNQFVQVCSKTKSIEKMRKHCNCVKE